MNTGDPPRRPRIIILNERKSKSIRIVKASAMRLSNAKKG